MSPTLCSIIAAASMSSSYPPQGCTPARTDESPRSDFRIEFYYCAEDEQTAVWLVNKTSGPAQLYQDAASGILPYIYISPDERFIFREQKLVSHVSAAWLYERSEGLHYREVTPSPFGDQAWEFFRHKTHNSFGFDYDHSIAGGTWLPEKHSMLVELNGDDGRLSVLGWLCYYDLQARRFYLDQTLQEKNRNAVSSHSRYSH